MDYDCRVICIIETKHLYNRIKKIQNDYKNTFNN